MAKLRKQGRRKFGDGGAAIVGEGPWSPAINREEHGMRMVPPPVKSQEDYQNWLGENYDTLQSAYNRTNPKGTAAGFEQWLPTPSGADPQQWKAQRAQWLQRFGGQAKNWPLPSGASPDVYVRQVPTASKSPQQRWIDEATAQAWNQELDQPIGQQERQSKSLAPGLSPLAKDYPPELSDVPRWLELDPVLGKLTDPEILPGPAPGAPPVKDYTPPDAPPFSGIQEPPGYMPGTILSHPYEPERRARGGALHFQEGNLVDEPDDPLWPDEAEATPNPAPDTLRKLQFNQPESPPLNPNPNTLQKLQYNPAAPAQNAPPAAPKAAAPSMAEAARARDLAAWQHLWAQEHEDILYDKEQYKALEPLRNYIAEAGKGNIGTWETTPGQSDLSRPSNDPNAAWIGFDPASGERIYSAGQDPGWFYTNSKKPYAGNAVFGKTSITPQGPADSDQETQVQQTYPATKTPAPNAAPNPPAQASLAPSGAGMIDFSRLFGLQRLSAPAPATTPNPLLQQTTDPTWQQYLQASGQDYQGTQGSWPAPAPRAAAAPTPAPTPTGAQAQPARQTGWRQYLPALQAAEQKYGLPPGALFGVMMAESSGNPNARSRYSTGLMQFTPGTAQQYGIDPLNPYQSIDAAGRYLQHSMGLFGNDLNKAIASYNAGTGAIARGRMPPETRAYVPKVRQNMTKAPYLQKISKGLSSMGAGTQPVQQSDIPRAPLMTQTQPINQPDFRNFLDMTGLGWAKGGEVHGDAAQDREQMLGILREKNLVKKKTGGRAEFARGGLSDLPEPSKKIPGKDVLHRAPLGHALVPVLHTTIVIGVSPKKGRKKGEKKADGGRIETAPNFPDSPPRRPNAIPPRRGKTPRGVGKALRGWGKAGR